MVSDDHGLLPETLQAMEGALFAEREADRQLAEAARSELSRQGCITYMGARQRRLARERAIAAAHAPR